MYLVEIAFAKSKECSVLYYFFFKRHIPSWTEREREMGKKSLRLKHRFI